MDSHFRTRIRNVSPSLDPLIADFRLWLFFFCLEVKFRGKFRNMVHILCASPFHKHLPNEQHIFNTRIILVKISRNVAYPYWMLLKGLFSMKFTDTFAKLKFWRCSLRRLQAGTKMCPPQMMFALFFSIFKCWIDF